MVRKEKEYKAINNDLINIELPLVKQTNILTVTPKQKKKASFGESLR